MRLKDLNYRNLILISSRNLDLTQQTPTYRFIKRTKPDIVILAAAKVGGIKANLTYPADFYYQNIMIQTNVLHGSYLAGVKKVLFLGSACMYPPNCPQPMKEEYLFTDLFEKTNEAYALAKAAGIKQCEYYNQQHHTHFICLTPSNLYGPGDNFHLDHAHVIPAMIHKMHLAKQRNSPRVEIWGTGKIKREFLYAEDLADAILFVLKSYRGLAPLNVGTGEDITIKALAYLIKDVVGYSGELIFNKTKPDGPKRKLLDVSKLFQLNWRPRHTLPEGLRKTYQWFCNNIRLIRK